MVEDALQLTFDYSDPFDHAVARVPSYKRKAMSKQCRAVLERLQRGPATSRELCYIAINYRARISELREHFGLTIHCEELSGMPSIYSIVRPK